MRKQPYSETLPNIVNHYDLPLRSMAPCWSGGNVSTIDWDTKDAVCRCSFKTCLVDSRNAIISVSDRVSFQRIYPSAFSDSTTSSILHDIQAGVFSHLSHSEFIERYSNLLNIDGNSVLANPEANLRGAEAFIMQSDSSVLGILIIHYYDWRILAPQLVFAIDRTDNVVTALKLMKFEQLFKLTTPPRISAEIAAIWIRPESRQVGLGGALFQHGMSMIANILGSGDVVFLTTKGLLSKDISDAIMNYLLATEKAANGLEPNSNNVRITGIPVSLDELENSIGSDFREFPVNPTSSSVRGFAERAKMHFLGYRRISSLYGKIW